MNKTTSVLSQPCQPSVPTAPSVFSDDRFDRVIGGGEDLIERANDIVGILIQKLDKLSGAQPPPPQDELAKEPVSPSFLQQDLLNQEILRVKLEDIRTLIDQI